MARTGIVYKGKAYYAVGGVEGGADGSQRFAMWLIDLPGCIAQGSSPGEAYSRLEAMAPPFFEALEKIGAPIPEPTALPAIIPGVASFYDGATGRSMALEGRDLAAAPSLVGSPGYRFETCLA